MKNSSQTFKRYWREKLLCCHPASDIIIVPPHIAPDARVNGAFSDRIFSRDSRVTVGIGEKVFKRIFMVMTAVEMLTLLEFLLLLEV